MTSACSDLRRAQPGFTNSYSGKLNITALTYPILTKLKYMVPEKLLADCLKKGKNVPLYTANTGWLKCGACEDSDSKLNWHSQNRIWQNWQMKSTSVNTGRGLARRRWPSSLAFPLFLFPYLLLPPLGDQWCRRTFRCFQTFMVPSSGGKALGWKEYCSDKSQKSCLLILSCSACHCTGLLFNC